MFTQPQEEVEVYVQEGMWKEKKKRMNGVNNYRVCLRVWGWGWGDGVAGVQGRACVRIHVHTRSRIISKIPVLASNLSTLVWGCERVLEEQRAGNVRWGWGGRGVLVRERVYVLNLIRTSTHIHTHPLINSILASGRLSIPTQPLSPAKEYGRGTISRESGGNGDGQGHGKATESECGVERGSPPTRRDAWNCVC
jgi:hypothetical protein